jgi:hypothetical protein
VWCGNGHLLDIELDGWKPMGRRLRHDHGVKTFAIDQTRTVGWQDRTEGGFSRCVNAAASPAFSRRTCQSVP